MLLRVTEFGKIILKKKRPLLLARSVEESPNLVKNEMNSLLKMPMGFIIQVLPFKIMFMKMSDFVSWVCTEA